MRECLNFGKAVGILERGAGNRSDELSEAQLVVPEQATDVPMAGVEARDGPSAHPYGRNQRRSFRTYPEVDGATAHVRVVDHRGQAPVERALCEFGRETQAGRVVCLDEPGL